MVSLTNFCQEIKMEDKMNAEVEIGLILSGIQKIAREEGIPSHPSSPKDFVCIPTDKFWKGKLIFIVDKDGTTISCGPNWKSDGWHRDREEVEATNTFIVSDPACFDKIRKVIKGENDES
jgi:hypothetical protein